MGVSEVDKKLSAVVGVTARYQRSIRLESDFEADDCIDGYKPQSTAINTLEILAKQVGSEKQRAFTWTGPYGGGKSSLALFLSALVSPNATLRTKAQAAIKDFECPYLKRLTSEVNDALLILPVTGSKADPGLLIADRMAILSGKTRGRKRQYRDAQTLVKDLEAICEKKGAAGAIVVLDELGKMLEWHATNNADINFFQDVAELFSRSDKTLILIGILHQSFESYVTKFDQSVRREWNKVQGRFVDLPMVSSYEETTALIADAIGASSARTEANVGAAQKVCLEIGERRPEVSVVDPELVARCWPLDAPTAVILSVSGKKRFSQNERSIFGFLASAEPFGFKEFLSKATVVSDLVYSVPMYFDYLRASLEPQILAGPDGTKWSSGQEAIARAERILGQIHIDLLKSITILEIFRDLSYLYPTTKALACCLRLPDQEVTKLLQELEKASIVIYRKHLDCWAIYGGSDVDFSVEIANAKNRARLTPRQVIDSLPNLSKVIARAHYQTTGALRWFDRSVIFVSELDGKDVPAPQGGAMGSFLLILPEVTHGYDVIRADIEELSERSASSVSEGKAQVIGLPTEAHAKRVLQLIDELSALLLLRAESQVIAGDQIARRELNTRIEYTSKDLEQTLVIASDLADWYFSAALVSSRNDLQQASAIASEVANTIFSDTPKIENELINRDVLSSSATKARRELIYQMVKQEHRPRLGYSGYGADAGIYYSVLEKLNLHITEGGVGRFSTSVVAGSVNEIFKNLWDETEKTIANSKEQVRVSDLYEIWARPPFGLKAGVMPVLFVHYYLANIHRLTLFESGRFVPSLTDIHIDELLRHPSDYSVQQVLIGDAERELMAHLMRRLGGDTPALFVDDSLAVARRLVSRILRLPGWTKRTFEISPELQKIRTALLSASDPNQLLFHEIPRLFGQRPAEDLAEAISSSVIELESLLPKRMAVVSQRLKELLGVESFEASAALAKELITTCGNPDLKVFYTHLSTYDGSYEKTYEFTAALVRKVPKDITDQDLLRAETCLAEFSIAMRKAKVLGELGKPGAGKVLLSLGTRGESSEEAYVVELAQVNQSELDKAKDKIRRTLKEVNGDISVQAMVALVQEKMKELDL